MAKVISLYKAQYMQGWEREEAYGALDTIGTLMIDNILEKQMKPIDERTMNFYLAVQNIALDMTIRGIKVNETEKEVYRQRLVKETAQVRRELERDPAIVAVWDRTETNSGACRTPTRKDGKHNWPRGVPDDDPAKVCKDCGAKRLKIRAFSPSSNPDMEHLYYDLWKLKPIRNKDGKRTADKEARGKLIDRGTKYTPVIEKIAHFADIKKKLEFLSFYTNDGRFHAGVNVGVTSTGRWSTNKDQFGRGGNAQNITESMRYMFEADDGYEIVYADLKQAESNVIAHVAGDEAYIEAHLMGDTHTYVCRLVWPEGINGQKWTWDDIAADKKIATSANPPWDDRPGHDYRFQSKAVQHGSNLGLTAFGLAIQKHIPVAAAQDSQTRYFRAFSGIKERYQRDIRNKVQDQEEIITPLGVKFKLFGRPDDEHTYKEGLAVIPQSMVGHIISIGGYRIYTQLPEVQMLMQVHDALLFQIPKGRYDLLYDALQLMTVPVPVLGLDGKMRTISIGTEAAVGHNWGHHNENPDKGPLNPKGIREITFTDREHWRIK